MIKTIKKQINRGDHGMKSNNSVKQFCFLLIHPKKQKPEGPTGPRSNWPAASATGEPAEPTVSTPETQRPDGFDEMKNHTIDLHNLRKFL